MDHLTVHTFDNYVYLLGLWVIRVNCYDICQYTKTNGPNFTKKTIFFIIEKKQARKIYLQKCVHCIRFVQGRYHLFLILNLFSIFDFL